MPRRIDHVLVVYDGSARGRRALLEGAAMADEHEAELSVITLVEHDERRVGCACAVSASAWNRMMDEIAEEDLAVAREILGEREPPTRFGIAPGHGIAAIRRVVADLGCDLVLVPGRARLGLSRTRRLRRALAAEVLEVRTA